MDLHVVCFAVPFPPDYGGAIEVWHRLRALAAEGVRVHAHAFVYGRFQPRAELEALAAQVDYYPRTLSSAVMRGGFPLSVHMRQSAVLLRRLQADHIPVLFEGVQTTAWAKVLEGRRLFLRAHNIEHQYYAGLAARCSGPAHWLYTRESAALARYEPAVARRMQMVFAISPADQQWFADQGIRAELLLPFHGYDHPDLPSGRGKYILYQGDLSLEVNQRAILEVIALAPPRPDRPLVVAGRQGNTRFEARIRALPNIIRHTDVSAEMMMRLIRDAQVTVIHSLHAAGMKLKLFAALYQSRFVAASPKDVTGTPLDQAVHTYTPDTLNALLDVLWLRDFDPEEVARRTIILAGLPDDRAKARQIIRYL